MFWESDAARFGEAGAKGWCNAADFAETIVNEGAAPSMLDEWFAAETAADKAQQRSARLSVDVADDPFRVVVFEDVLPVLFPITSPEVRVQAIYALLNYLGIDVCPPDTSTNAPSTSDPYLHWKLGSSPAMRSRMWPARPTEMALPWRDTGVKEQDSLSCPVKAWISETGTMLATGDWFSDIDLADEDVDLVRYALSRIS